MFHFEHGPVPHDYWFDEGCTSQIRQILDYIRLHEKERKQTDPPLFISAEKKMPGSSIFGIKSMHSIGKLREDIQGALNHASSGRCAFCERKAEPLSAYRFRPLQAFDKDIHHNPYNYAFLIWDWKNFYPICLECNHYEQRIFPIYAGLRMSFYDTDVNVVQKQLNITKADPQSLRQIIEDEKPLLIHPGEDVDYASSFAISRDGKMLGMTPRSAATIDYYDLNRLELHQARRERLYEYVENLRNKGPAANFDFKSSEFGGAWYLYMRKIIGPMLRETNITERIYPDNMQPIVRQLFAHPIWKDFDNFFETLEVFNSYLLHEHLPEDMAMALPPEVDTGEKRAELIGAQPRLIGISVENFKSLASIDIKIGKTEDQSQLVTQDVEYDHRTDCLLMLGENATGKSSLLEAVTMATISPAALTALQDDPVIGIKPSHLILNPKYMGSPKAKLPKAAKINLTFQNSADTPITRSLTINPKGFVHGKAAKDDILIFAYGAHRLFGNSGKDDETGNPAQDVLTLFRNDVMTIDPEKWLIELDARNDGSLDIIARALRHVIQLDGKFENIEIVREKGEKPFCQINLKRAQIGTGLDDNAATDEGYIFSTPMKYVSSGYRVIIALICDVFKGIMKHLERRVGDSGLAVTAELAREMPVLILIDEVEAHLHPRWKLEVISGLRRALPQATFLMSSHDPLCIRGMNNGEVIVFHRYQLDNGSDKITREKVETITEFPDFRQLTVEQLLTSELFSLYSTDDRRIEKEFGNIITLLAQEKKGEINESGQDMLTAFRSHVTEQLHKALPVGSTEIERLVHEAVEEFLSKRRTNNQEVTDKLRRKAKAKIIEALQKVAGPTA